VESGDWLGTRFLRCLKHHENTLVGHCIHARRLVIHAMRTIKIIRHSYTKKGAARGKGSHLSAEGVALAREIGNNIGTFDFALTSHGPQTLETAIAMGFAVDEQLEALGDITPEVIGEIGHHERWTWEYPFLTFAQFVERAGSTQ
jgi:hypothetical protein